MITGPTPRHVPDPVFPCHESTGLCTARGDRWGTQPEPAPRYRPGRLRRAELQDLDASHPHPADGVGDHARLVDVGQDPPVVAARRSEVRLENYVRLGDVVRNTQKFCSRKFNTVATPWDTNQDQKNTFGSVGTMMPTRWSTSTAALKHRR